jgi:hypothetical protein
MAALCLRHDLANPLRDILQPGRVDGCAVHAVVVIGSDFAPADCGANDHRVDGKAVHATRDSRVAAVCLRHDLANPLRDILQLFQAQGVLHLVRMPLHLIPQRLEHLA